MEPFGGTDLKRYCHANSWPVHNQNRDKMLPTNTLLFYFYLWWIDLLQPGHGFLALGSWILILSQVKDSLNKKRRKAKCSEGSPNQDLRQHNPRMNLSPGTGVNLIAKGCPSHPKVFLEKLVQMYYSSTRVFFGHFLTAFNAWLGRSSTWEFCHNVKGHSINLSSCEKFYVCWNKCSFAGLF